MSRMWERLDMDPNDKETWNPWRGKLFSRIEDHSQVIR